MDKDLEPNYDEIEETIDYDDSPEIDKAVDDLILERLEKEEEENVK